MKTEKYFYFEKKYKTKEERKSDFHLNLKQKLFYSILDNKYLKNHLNSIDRFYKFKDERDVRVYKNLYSDKRLFKTELKNHKTLKLPYISFYEVIEIDKFDSFKQKLISNFSKKHTGFGRDIKYKDELIEKLNSVKISLDTSGFGKLISLNFKKLKARHSNLIDFVNISYLKTRESFFILHLEITTSEKFNELFTKITESSETGLSVRHFHSYKNILKFRIFNAHTTFKSSLTRENIDNLISDLQFQINHNILSHLDGFFNKNNLESRLPKTLHFTIKDLHSFKQGKDIDSFFNFNNINQFTSNDKLVDIYLDEGNNNTYIIKEEGHGKKENSSTDHTDYDRLESYFLIQSLTFPSSFQAILNEDFERINQIKREMYDFLEISNKWSFYNYFQLINLNIKYMRLKKEITKLNLISSRYKNEFNERTLNFLINHSTNISEYSHSDKNRRFVENLNLYKYFENNFTECITHLRKKIQDVNDIFKSIEELNSYRTNFILQIVSLSIAILAFVFAFDKVKNMFNQ